MQLQYSIFLQTNAVKHKNAFAILDTFRCLWQLKRSCTVCFTWKTILLNLVKSLCEWGDLTHVCLQEFFKRCNMKDWIIMIFFHLTDSALPNFCFVFLSLVNKSQEKNVLGLVFSVCNSPLERVLDLRRRSKVYPKLERAGLQSVNTLLKGYDNCTLKKKSTKAAQRSYLTFNVCWGRRTSNHRTIASCSFFLQPPCLQFCDEPHDGAFGSWVSAIWQEENFQGSVNPKHYNKYILQINVFFSFCITLYYYWSIYMVLFAKNMFSTLFNS